jgi:hypothetical protein
MNGYYPALLPQRSLPAKLQPALRRRSIDNTQSLESELGSADPLRECGKGTIGCLPSHFADPDILLSFRDDLSNLVRPRFVLPVVGLLGA